MLDDLLKKLKSYLPSKKADEVDEDDETGEYEFDEEFDDDEEEEDEDSGTEVLGKRTKKSSEGEDEEDEEEEEEEADPAEKRSKIIKIVIGVGVAYLVVEMLFLDEEATDDSAPSVAQQQQEEQVSEQEIRERALEERRRREQEQQEQQEEQQQDLAEFEPPDDTDSDEAIAFDPPDEPSPQDDGVTGVDDMIHDTGTDEREDADLAFDIPDDSDYDDFDDFSPPPSEGVGEEDTGRESDTDTIATMDDILQRVGEREAETFEYVSPPDYERIGRGLVYNCSGSHWACVNRESYFTCRDNSQWAEQEGEAPECYPVAVYATEEDCRIVQAYNVNTLESTDFCQVED